MGSGDCGTFGLDRPPARRGVETVPHKLAILCLDDGAPLFLKDFGGFGKILFAVSIILRVVAGADFVEKITRASSMYSHSLMVPRAMARKSSLCL